MPKLLITILVLTLTLSSCFSNIDNNGSDTILKEKSNFGLDKKAILFIHEGGATVSESYQISVINNTDKFDTTSIGNTFTVDNDHNKTRLDSNTINFKWRSNDSLEIDYDKKLRVFKMEKNVSGVTIIYRVR